MLQPRIKHATGLNLCVNKMTLKCNQDEEEETGEAERKKKRVTGDTRTSPGNKEGRVQGQGRNKTTTKYQRDSSKNETRRRQLMGATQEAETEPRD